MTQNSSPHWDRSRRERTPPEQPQPDPTAHSAPPDSYADLFAVLDRADVSEAVRAALAHALNPPTPPDLPTDPDAHRRLHHARETSPNLRLRSIGRTTEPRRRYTLHVTFPAHDLLAARHKAALYAEALLLLRPELTAHPALLSRADQWNHSEPITCGRPGPDGEVCVRAADHPGCHWDSVLGGSCWSIENWSTEKPTGSASYCDRTEDR
ncbi:hypothetical protein ABGB07_02565 [Micromonosporaceae bacterium B7E4]